MATPEQVGELERLQGLVAEAQRGEADLGDVELTRLSQELRQRVLSEPEVDLLWAAESLQALAKLLELKMGRQLEAAEGPGALLAPEADSGDDPGERLAEYRLFKAAAGVLLADADAGPKAFLRVLGLPVEPRSRLQLSPESLALALGELLARLPEPSELEMNVPRYSVTEKMAELRRILEREPALRFDQLFEAAHDRLEAVALFMALLELLFTGEVSCVQVRPGAAIMVERASAG